MNAFLEEYYHAGSFYNYKGIDAYHKFYYSLEYSDLEELENKFLKFIYFLFK